ncbi:hypothetical protein GCM10023342_02430 [Modicisalibacter zincidurans]|uniref:Uncharacterized protein n=1 Tax=Modicisalibacter zincidurans TaxID=1178777 RepID=A0ABP9QZJ5_9GAMM
MLAVLMVTSYCIVGQIRDRGFPGFGKDAIGAQTSGIVTRINRVISNRDISFINIKDARGGRYVTMQKLQTLRAFVTVAREGNETVRPSVASEPLCAEPLAAADHLPGHRQ